MLEPQKLDIPCPSLAPLPCWEAEWQAAPHSSFHKGFPEPGHPWSSLIAVQDLLIRRWWWGPLPALSHGVKSWGEGTWLPLGPRAGSPCCGTLWQSSGMVLEALVCLQWGGSLSHALVHSDQTHSEVGGWMHMQHSFSSPPIS